MEFVGKKFLLFFIVVGILFAFQQSSACGFDADEKDLI
jgi:hypothetical protein